MTRLRLNSKLLGCTALLLGLTARVQAHAPGLDKELPALSQYLRLGVEHILTGFDHLAFLLGLIVLAGSLRSLLFAVTAFTLAHSLSLGLAMFGVLAPPTVWIETLIALSIAYVGLENLVARDASARWRITLLFGFVHGFGFAGALQEIGVPPERAPAALALFNLGVELGQLAVLLVIVPVLVWLRRRKRFWTVGARVLNALLVAMGLAWAVERGLGLGNQAVATEEPPLAADDKPKELASAYPHDPPRSAAAARLCEVFQQLPRARRASCTGSATGLTFERECTRLLSGALAANALAFDTAAANSCEAIMRTHYANCSFVQAAATNPEPACTTLWQGRLQAGQLCRSALECQPGLTCHGAGPFDQGLCAAPKKPGQSCGRTLDQLAAYLPHNELDHPECETTCDRGRCSPGR